MKRVSLLYAVVVPAILLTAVAVLTASGQDAAPQAPLGTAFTYQGRLQAGDQPVEGPCDLAFRLYDDPVAGSPVAAPITATVVLSDGLFTQALDFGAGVFTGDARWLDIRVLCPGDAAFTPLGRQALTAAPYAHYAGSTGALDGRPLDPAQPLIGQALKWDGAAWGPAADDDTTYAAGFGLALVDGTFAVDPATVQARVDQACGPGYAVAAVHEDGGVTCTPVGSGTITAVNAGAGLTGGGDAGPITLTVAFDGPGTADAVARSDHHHDGVYSLLGHTHTGDEITTPVMTATYALTAGDADTLDGQHAADFAPAAHGHHSLDAADGSPTEAVYVDNDGRVGIGTTAPAGALHVATPSMPNALVVLPNGDVGVGTDAPYEAQFHIINPDTTAGSYSSLKIGGLEIPSSTPYNAALNLRTSAGGVATLYFHDRYQGTGVQFRKEADVGNGNWFRVINRHDWATDRTVYEFYNAGGSSSASDRMGILVPLGVGTSNPTAALHVAGDAAVLGDYNRVFVTSQLYNGNLGGLAGADALCQARADAAGLPGTYRAWLSDGTTNAADRLIHSMLPYRLVDGTPIAQNWADLTNGSLAAPIIRTEFGSAITSSFSVRTSTLTNGVKAGGNYCNGWTTTDPSCSYGAFGFGRADNAGSEWTHTPSGGCYCGNNQRLYCIQQEGEGNLYVSGRVGVGTDSPHSALQVEGYLQLDTLTAAPPAADCDEAAEYGRMKVDVTNSLLYICTASGWVTK
jgi:hypothetical protein